MRRATNIGEIVLYFFAPIFATLILISVAVRDKTPFFNGRFGLAFSLLYFCLLVAIVSSTMLSFRDNFRQSLRSFRTMRLDERFALVYGCLGPASLYIYDIELGTFWGTFIVGVSSSLFAVGITRFFAIFHTEDDYYG